MKNIKIATAQFENKSADKKYNLGVIRKLSAQAAEQGAQAVATLSGAFEPPRQRGTT